MAVNVPRERQLRLALGVGEVLNAVIVGMECTEDSLFDLDIAKDGVYPFDERMLDAALVLIAALFNERNILPHEIFERIPALMAEVALQDLE
jgi:hypothetical protein